MEISGSVALVTGANRGLGAVFCRALLERGASKVYAAARNADDITIPGVVPLQLDITKPDEVRAAAASRLDVSILVNNAGIMRLSPLIRATDDGAARDEMEVNFFGTLAMSRAFAPILADNGGGALVNVLSVASWLTPPRSGSYGASKSAAWSLTNGTRLELREQGTLVVAVHAGFIDTDMAAGVKTAKVSPETVARLALDGIEAGSEEVLADDESRRVKSQLSRDHELIYPALQAAWDARRR